VMMSGVGGVGGVCQELKGLAPYNYNSFYQLLASALSHATMTQLINESCSSSRAFKQTVGVHNEFERTEF